MVKILIVDDDAALREGLAETVADLGHRLAFRRLRPRGSGGARRRDFDCVLLDLRMPGGMDGIEVLRRIRAQRNAPPVIVLTAFATAENTIEAMRLGAFDHLTKPVGREELRALLSSLPAAARRSASSDGRRREHAHRLERSDAARAEDDRPCGRQRRHGVDPRRDRNRQRARGARLTRTRRAQGKPFVAVNCAAIPADLLESELFGHVKGAFTGATTDRAGAFREAASGTLLLDEIGDMPLPMQGKILRAIEERVVTPVGGKPVPVRGPRRSPRPTATCQRSWRTAHSARTSTIVSTWFRSCCHRCASGATISCRSRRSFCGARHGTARRSA